MQRPLIGRWTISNTDINGQNLFWTPIRAKMDTADNNIKFSVFDISPAVPQRNLAHDMTVISSRRAVLWFSRLLLSNYQLILRLSHPIGCPQSCAAYCLKISIFFCLLHVNYILIGYHANKHYYQSLTYCGLVTSYGDRNPRKSVEVWRPWTTII